ncbi:hypothetical protein [Mucilaginibacter sp.]|uniref:hypothetical protein n=1 Tax=Mucilaginibacter sp. TaxID=1882438 RepID=UPI0035BBD5C0
MKLLLLLLFINKNKPAVDTPVTKPPYFIAMQYKGMSNCIYKVFVTDSTVMAAKVNGYIGVSSPFKIGTTVPANVMHDPEAYINRSLSSKYDSLLNDNQKFVKADKQNFIIRKEDIKRVYHNPEKKWGMGYYPHNGRIEIQTTKKVKGLNSETEREFILIGDQDPKTILKLFDVK